ncbi:GIY-YIG nuclease family protein [Frigidibacter sp. MR17.24]|uniref:GIY-YIG nuclease family protein n=1 Tax=Frigidibacter sp. MR17.24 TaxID=3127345 RepID=UPI003012E534
MPEHEPEPEPEREPGPAPVSGPVTGPGEARAFVYVLGRLGPRGAATYVGWTLDLDRRLAEHNSGLTRGAKSTRGGGWALLYAECLPSRRAAMSREWHLKRDRALRRRLAAGLRA